MAPFGTIVGSQPILRVGILGLLVGPLFFAGCASLQSHRVGVNSFVGADTAGLQYSLLPDMAGVEMTDLQFQEVCNYLRPVLAAKRMIETKDPRDADVFVFVSYGLGEPITQTINIPTLGKTSPGETATYSGTISGTGGTYASYGTVSKPATWGVTGYQSRTKVTLPKYLRLLAFDCKRYVQTKETVFFWQVMSATGDENGDLRAAIPFLVAGISDYIGRSTGRVIWVQVANDDPRLPTLQAGK